MARISPAAAEAEAARQRAAANRQRTAEANTPAARAAAETSL